MKRILTFILVFMMTLILSACTFGQRVPKGYINAEEHFDTEGFQDYTDYCKYYYQDKSAVEKDARYNRVSKADIAAISNYFAHFWSSAATNVANAYDFNPDSISEGDYVLIETKEGKPIGDSFYGKYDNYSVYFFDTDSCVLYYIHSNI